MIQSSLDRARQALETVNDSPAAAIEMATSVLAESTDAETLATAHFACGLAHRILADGTQSTSHLEHAVEYAAAHPELCGKVLRSLAFNYAQAGNHRRADSTIARSIELLDDEEANVSRLQQAFILLMRGEHQAALPVLDTAVLSFTRQGAEANLELTLHNRALVHMEFGDYDASINDLERAYAIATRLNRNASASTIALHLSQVLGWRDDIPGAMRWHTLSVELGEAAGAASPVADMEHAYVLVQARLMREAEAILTSTLPKLERAGDNQAILVSGRLLLIDVLMEKGDHDGALRQVEIAADETPEDGRWRFDVAAARHKVRIAAGDSSRELLDAMVATADDMEANGERHAAVSERCRAVPVALAVGADETARQLRDAINPFTRSGPLWLQIQVWTALAQMRLHQGNRRGAVAALRAGMTRLDVYRTGIGSTDLRIHARAHGRTLAALGVRLAIESGSPERVFAWTERLRTTTATAEGADRGEMAALLTTLRRATSVARRASSQDRSSALRTAANLETRIRRLSRQREGIATNRSIIDLGELRHRLEDHSLVTYVDDAGTLYALAVDGARHELIDLGTSHEIVGLVDHLRFSAERIARPSTSAASRLAAITSARELVTSIRERVVTPLEVSTPRAVVVPTAALSGVPWTMMFDIPVITAPSASVWLAAKTRPSQSGGALVVTGPNLEHAAREADEIAAISDGRVVSSVDAATQLLAERATVHFACHARPRTDSPLFSSLVLDDGELTLYDIERLARVPSQIVIAACSGAGSLLASGDEVLSLAGSFLDMGARTVVAPLFTVSDELTHEVMTTVHTAVARGDDFASAIRLAARADDPGVAFTAGSFICVGAI